MLRTLGSSSNYTRSKCLLYRGRRFYSNSTNRSTTHLEGLNESQRRAVSFPPSSSLQILAGPGTGKTRVLTSRIAEFVLNHSFPPSSICAVTFTKKASKEMKSRLTGYIGANPTNELKLGTFHSLCAQYLRSYGAIIGVGPKFAIWDEEEWQVGYHPNLVGRAARITEVVAIIKERQRVDPASPLQGILEEQRDKGGNGREAYNKNDPLYDPNIIQKILDEYSFVLSKSEALDFTDLLIKGLDVIQAAPWAQGIKELRHVLVDEFQDTSSLQYLIVQQLFKVTQNRVSVVGDPDQSIYGWRGTENSIFERMIKDLPQTTAIYLEQNYRSTASILAAAVNIISQDTTRPPKTLFTSHSSDGPKAFLESFPDMRDESDFIGLEIKRIVERSEGLLGPARTEQEGKKLKVVGDLMNESIERKLTLYDVIQQIHEQGDLRALPRSGKSKPKKPSVYDVATRLVKLLAELRVLIAEGKAPADLLQHVLKSTGYIAYLERVYGEDGMKWREWNINKLNNYAENFRASTKADPRGSLYAFFDFMSSLSRPPDEDTGAVTLLTCHSAKGLEWPVVFIPEVVDGVYPHVRASDPDEERRLLYVACTRAQCLLYITHSKVKMTSARDDKIPLALYASDFLKDMSPEFHHNNLPGLNEEELLLFQRILGRVKATGDRSDD